MAGQELNTALTDGESILLECLGNTENLSEPLPSIEDLFDFYGYESSTIEVLVSSCTGALERRSNYCTSVTVEESSKEQPKTVSIASPNLQRFANSPCSAHSDIDDNASTGASPVVDNDVVLVNIHPVTKSAGAPLEDNKIIIVDSFAFKHKRKLASKALRRTRITATRTCPYDRSNPTSRKRLGKWDTFAEEWSQIDEAFQDRLDLRAQLAGVRGYVEILENK